MNGEGEATENVSVLQYELWGEVYAHLATLVFRNERHEWLHVRLKLNSLRYTVNVYRCVIAYYRYPSPYTIY